jgi:predicted ATPase
MTLCHRAINLWLLGYPDAARADMDRALSEAREFQHAATVMYALNYNSIVNALRRDIAKAQTDELVALADEKGAVFWKASGGLVESWRSVLAGRASDAVTSFSSAIAMFRSTGATIFVPLFLSMLGSAFAQLRQFDQARRCIGEAMALAEASGERWFDAEIYRIAASARASTTNISRRSTRHACD